MNGNYTKFLEETVEQTAKMMSTLCREMRTLRAANESLMGTRELMMERISELEKKLKEMEARQDAEHNF